jgi:rhomboid protease GluP
MSQDYPNSGSPTSPPVVSTDQPVTRPVFIPYVTYTLIAICVVVYLIQFGTLTLLGTDIPAALGVKDYALIMQGQIWRLLTPMFLHSDQTVLHIAFNMYALFIIGRPLERFYGRGRYLALFILSGFTGNVFSFMFTTSQSLGSSTAIFGLLGAEGVLIYQNREIFGANARRALTEVVVIAVINLIIGLTPGIDNWGHVGGLIGGTLFAWFGGPLLQVKGPFTVVDTRTRREVIRAGIGVSVLFIFITIFVIFVRKG